MDERERALGGPDALAGRGDLAEPDRVVDALGLVAAPAAEVDDGQADGAHVDALRRTRPVGLGGDGDRAALGRWRSGASSRSAGPPSAATIRAKRSAAAPDSSAAARVGVEAAEAQQLRR